MGILRLGTRMLCATVLLAGGATASTLTGIVVDGNSSTPIPHAAIEVAVLIPDSVSLYDTSNATGAYSVTGIPGGNAIYVILCRVSGYAAFYMRYDALTAGDRQVDIVMWPKENPPSGGGGDSTTVAGVVLFELPGGGRNPVSQATVALNSGLGQASTQTGSDGKYSMRARRGSYALAVNAAGFQPLSATGVGVDSGGLTLNVLVKPNAVAIEPADNRSTPKSFALGNAYPNPFNPSTTILYELPERAYVTLKVFNLLGQEVATLVEGIQEAGYRSVVFNARNLVSGIYFYRLKTERFTGTRTLVLSR